MGALRKHNVENVHHYSPLHYLPFIGRSMAFRNKPSLANARFPPTHLRSMSSHHDVARGFGDFTHLTLDKHPRILKVKLAAGFPHIGLAVPAEAIEATDFDLCRFNVAMTRQLRRDGMPGFEESATNGRYYEQQQIPTARTEADKEAMLAEHLPAGTMIEVLVRGDLPLPQNTTVICYSDPDADLARKILSEVGAPWPIITEPPPGSYPRSSSYAAEVSQFVEFALADPNWRGNGLEYDRV